MASCVSKIYYFPLCLFKCSYFYRWLECYAEQEKIVRCRWWWYHHWHWWDFSKRRLLLNVAHIILGWILSVLFSDFKALELSSLPTSPIAALKEFFDADAGTNVDPLLASWYFISMLISMIVHAYNVYMLACRYCRFGLLFYSG